MVNPDTRKSILKSNKKPIKNNEITKTYKSYFGPKIESENIVSQIYTKNGKNSFYVPDKNLNLELIPGSQKTMIKRQNCISK